MASQDIMIIDGSEYTFEPGETILQVAQRNNIEIPTLCYLKGASPTGACRVCLVEVEGARTLVASCAMPASKGMVVRTNTPKVIEARRLNIELLLASGHHNCLAQDRDLDTWADFQVCSLLNKLHQDVCPAYGRCKLQDLAIKYRVKETRFPADIPRYAVEDVNPFIVRDFSRCILCGRCVQACNEIQVNNAISYGYRGARSKIVTKGDRPLKDSDCVFCGECLQVCPVGALVDKREYETKGYLLPTKKVRTTCSYCGVGCQIYLHVRDNKVVKVTGVEDVGPNYGSLCVKGRFGYDFTNHPERLKTPLIKRNGQFHEASWEEALDYVAKRLSEIRDEYGPENIGVLVSARITNEENYLAQKFARAVLKTNNVDHCARL